MWPIMGGGEPFFLLTSGGGGVFFYVIQGGGAKSFLSGFEIVSLLSNISLFSGNFNEKMLFLH